MPIEIKARGSEDAKLWIIGDFPRDADLQSNILHSTNSKSGQFLSEQLIISGCGEARMEVLSNVKPKKGTLKKMEEDPVEFQYLHANIATLKKKIKKHEPNLVLLLGPTVLEYLGEGRKDINAWRGHVFWHEECKCKMMATYSPGHVLRQMYFNSHRAEQPGQLRALFNHDMHKAKEEMGKRNLTYTPHSLLVLDEYEKAKKYLLDALATAKILSFDIEIVKPYESYFMDCIGLAYTREVGACLPLYKVREGKFEPLYTKQQAGELFGLLKILLESDIPKVGQNIAQFDILVLWEHYGMKTRNVVWDTMIAAHNIYCELPKDLGTLISMYANLPYMKQMIKTGKYDDRWEYCAMDALANLHVMDGQVELMKEHNTYDHYKNITNPAIMPLIDMQKTGVFIDEKYREITMRHENQIVSQIESILALIFNNHSMHKGKDPRPFNPGSPDQKKKLFYGLFKVPVKYKKGSTPTVDKNAMEEIKLSDRRYCVRLLADICLRYRAAVAMYGKLATPTRRGRMHSEYGLGGIDKESEDVDHGKIEALGTETGRLNSRASKIMNVYDPTKRKWVSSGSNLQNLAKGPQRDMVIPDQEEIFCHVDLYAAEAFLVAMDAREDKLIEMLFSGNKIHNWLLDYVVNTFGDAAEKAGFDYHNAKTCIHAMNYDVEPKTISYQTGLPIEFAQQVYNMYHRKFPGIKLRMQAIRDKLEQTQELYSLLGRRRQFFGPMNHDTYKEAYAWPSQSVIGELTIYALSKLWEYSQSWKLSEKVQKPRSNIERPWCFPALNTHDGIAIRCLAHQRKMVVQAVLDAFNVPLQQRDITLTIPIEIGWGNSFNEVIDKEVHWYGQNTGS